MIFMGFPGGSVVKNPPANAGDTGLITGPGSRHETTKAVCHNYWACAVEQGATASEPLCSRAPALQQEKPLR